MSDFFRRSGTTPFSILFVQSISRGLAKAVLQFLSLLIQQIVRRKVGIYVCIYIFVAYFKITSKDLSPIGGIDESKSPLGRFFGVL